MSHTKGVESNDEEHKNKDNNNISISTLNSNNIRSDSSNGLSRDSKADFQYVQTIS